jgi:hypothetical protein
MQRTCQFAGVGKLLNLGGPDGLFWGNAALMRALPFWCPRRANFRTRETFSSLRSDFLPRAFGVCKLNLLGTEVVLVTPGAALIRPGGGRGCDVEATRAGGCQN